MGDPDPSDFISQETNQIPFKQSVVKLPSWNTKTPFRNWPKMPQGWRNWFRKVSEKKGGDWKLYDLNQCLTPSLSGMEKNDSLLISASYFWSNALNAFVFGHGPMTITLADVYMLTGLNVTGSVQPYEYFSARSKKLAKISDCTGWASYILNHIRDESNVSEREYVAFLNMWLERFVFCGSSCGLTYNHKLMAEHLVVGKDIPLGKYLLGSTYHLMYQVSAQLLKNESVHAISSP